MSYAIIKFIHILLLVFWLGTDLGVLILSKKFRDFTLSVETRVMLLRMAMIVDTLPRICFIVMLPVGIHLANSVGVLNVGTMETLGLWILAAVLLTINMMAAKNMGTVSGVKLQRLNWVVLGITGSILIFVAVISIKTGSPVAASWLAVKIGIYGLIYWLAIGIDWAFMPIGAQVAQLLEKGSSEELEKDITHTVDKAVWFVFGVYVATLVAAFIGIAKFNF